MATLEKAESQPSKAEAARTAPSAPAPAPKVVVTDKTAPAAPPPAVKAAAARDPQRDKAIELAVSTIEKQFGKGSIMRLGEDVAPPEVKVVPTGSLGLDIALGVGGLPRGRVVEVYGPESSGKTTLALHVVAEAQKAGGICAFVDAEHALDVGYARKLGVRTDDLLVSQPDFGEQALEITEMLVRSGAIDVIVVDSVAALVPRAEIEGEMGDAHMGVQARLMSQALRKLTGAVSKSGTVIFFINQIRMKIGVVFGNPETTTGGNALKFYASVRMEIRRLGNLKDGDTVIGTRTRVKVVKNKVAPPFHDTEFDVLYGQGISRAGEALDLAVTLGLAEKSGSHFLLDGERIGQGRERAVEWLRERPQALDALVSRILTAGAHPPGPQSVAESVAA
jgi:recombination protein RecA